MLKDVVSAKIEYFGKFFEENDEKVAEKSSLHEQLYDKLKVEAVQVDKLKLTEYER